MLFALGTLLYANAACDVLMSIVLLLSTGPYSAQSAWRKDSTHLSPPALAALMQITTLGHPFRI